MLKLSKHAEERLSERLRGIVTRTEIETAVRRVGRFGVGETAIRIKHLPRTLRVSGADGSVSTGNTVFVVYRRDNSTDEGLVTTVELRGSWQGPAARWTKVINLA